MATKMMAAFTGSTAILPMLVSLSAMILIGMFSRTVIPIPISPAAKPTMAVSALTTREMSLLAAPTMRRIQISFVRSNTEIYVIIPIIMEDTTSEIETKPIRP